MRVLLTGAYGQLERCLLDRFPADWITLACGSAELDITDRVAVVRVVKKFKPDVIMNAAAYTAVDKAETDRTRALKINAIGPENLAQAAKMIGARFIHISTDYVFDGVKKTPYTEQDPPCPINFYGLSKWEGEKRVFEVLPEAIVIRTSWMFSEYGNNFVSTMLRLAQTRSELHVVNDQYGCPTYAGDLAQAIHARRHARKARPLPLLWRRCRQLVRIRSDNICRGATGRGRAWHYQLALSVCGDSAGAQCDEQ